MAELYHSTRKGDADVPPYAATPSLACCTATVDLEQMPLDGEVRLAAETHEKIVEDAALEGDNDAAGGADEVVEVTGEAGHIACLRRLCVNAGQPARFT